MGVGKGELLLVHEQTSTGEEITKFLESSGYSVNASSTEADCLREVDQSAPDLVLLTLDEPSIDFLQLIDSIRDRTEILPIVVFTRENFQQVVVRALESGASDYAFLPVPESLLLLHVIDRNLAQAKELVGRRENDLAHARVNKNLVENLRVLERDQRAGFQVQRSMMPVSPYRVSNVTFSHKLIPSLILSGDFIDYFELSDQRLLFYIADVSGHGVSSAFVTVVLKNLSRRLKKDFEKLELSSTGDILDLFNRELLESELEHHVTMFLGLIDRQKRYLDYSNAAQFPAAIISSIDATEYLEIGGLPLGLYENPNYTNKRLELPEEFTLVMFSDGVFEIMSQQTLKAKEDFLLSLVKWGNRSIETLADHLGLNTVQDVPDDIALFTVARVS